MFFYNKTYTSMKKRTLLSLTLSLIMLLFVPALTYLEPQATNVVVPDNDNAESKLHLIVTPHEQDGHNGLQNVPSCLHSKSHLQFTNTHKSDSLTITSIETFPTDGTLQMYVSKFQNRSVHIEPQSSVLLPITFVPRIYSRQKKKKSKQTSNSDKTKRKILSKAAIADLADLIESDESNPNLIHDLHSVETLLDVRTSRGTYLTYIRGSAMKSNPYRLPHEIIFYNDGFVASGEILAEQERLKYLASEKRRSTRYSFDLHIRNPWYDRPMFFGEIFTTRPDLIQLSFQHDGIFRFNNCKTSDDSCNVPKSHDIDGPPIVPADSEMIYLVTLSLDPKKMQDLIEDGIEIIEVAELRLVSSKETFSVLLRYSNTEVEVVEKDDNADNSRSMDKKTEEIENLSTAPISFQRHGRRRLDCDPMNKETSVMVEVSPNPRNEQTKSRFETGNLISSPSYLDFGLLTRLGENREVGISITNSGNHSLRLMRKTVSLEISSTGENNEEVDNYVVILSPPDDDDDDDDDDGGNIDFPFKAELHSRGRSAIIQQGTREKDIVSLSITSTFVPRLNETFPDVYRGTVLLHFGPSLMSSNEWKNSVINDPFGSQQYIVEIPFLVKIMHGVLQYDLSSVYFPATETSFYKPSKSDSSCAEGFHRKIHFTHNFQAPLRLTGLSIQSQNSTHSHNHVNECQHVFEIFDFEGSKQNRKHSSLATTTMGNFWGAITLRYNYRSDLSKAVTMEKCVLVLDTDLVGSFFVPLHIYSAFTKVESDKAIVPSECQNADGSANDMALDCFRKALSSDEYFPLSTMNHSKKKSVQKLMRSLANEHIKSLSKSLTDEVNMSVTPIFFSLGSLPSNSVEKYSIYLKNYNPIPLVINAVTSAIEGMEIRMAKTSVEISDFFQKAEGMIQGNQHLSNKWLKRFLMTSEISQDILQSFVMCDDVSPLPNVSDGMKKMFKKHARVRFYPDEDSSIRNKTAPSNDELRTHPPSFQQPGSKYAYHQDRDRHFLIIGNKAFGLKKEDSHQPAWTIPPGGVAKLELLVKSPPPGLLADGDITEVFTAGVVLYSNIGEIIPIFASYQVLSGSFKIIPSSTSSFSATGINHVKIPSVFRSQYDPKHLSMKNKESNKQQSFLIENGFSTDVLLRKVNSCNRWMQIEIHLDGTEERIHSSDTLLLHSGETVLASVHSTIHCSPKDIGLAHPTFYHCILEWLKHRQILISDECAKTNSVDGFQVSLINMTKEFDQSFKSAVRAFTRVTTYLNEKYNHRVRSDFSSYKDLPFHLLDSFNQAFYQWVLLCKKGQNIVTGSAQAQFDLVPQPQSNLTAVDMPQIKTITTILEKLSFNTSIEFPKLFDVDKIKLHRNNSSTKGHINTIDFGLTPVSKSSKAYVPVTNPTGHTIRVRLVFCSQCSAAGESSVFVQTESSLKHPWWTGGSYFLEDGKGELLISNHNVTIETASGSSLSLMNPSLHSSTSFTRGCAGRRCGGPFPDGNTNSNDYLQRVSPIGGSSSVTEYLIGRVYDSNGRSERQQSTSFSPEKYPPFALGSQGIAEVTIPPFGSKLLGPLYFRPTSRTQFAASAWLENSVTGLEAIQLKGKGGIEKVVFLETNDMNTLGGRIETRFNKPTLIFDRMSNEPQGPLFRDVLIANVGDFEVKLNSISLRNTQIKEQKDLNKQENYTKCQQRGFRIIDCVEYEDNNKSNSFTLKPKEARLLRLMHDSDCSFSSLYVSLVLDFFTDNLQSTNSLELLLGYNLSPSDVDICTKTLTLQKGTYHWKDILQMSLFILPLAILSLILIDLFCTVHRRRFSSMGFRAKAMMTGNKSGFKNWVAAFHCLSRGDHDSTDLTNLGKEQTRQTLLARYRKDGMAQPQCILQSGALNQERHVFGGNSTENPNKSSNASSEPQTLSQPTCRRATTTVVKTLSETLFAFTLSSKESSIRAHNGMEVMVPKGLDWKKAVKSGIAQWASISTKRQSKINSVAKNANLSTTKKDFPIGSGKRDRSNQVQVKNNCHQKQSPIVIQTDAAREKSSKSLPNKPSPRRKVSTKEVKRSNSTPIASELTKSERSAILSKQLVGVLSQGKAKPKVSVKPTSQSMEISTDTLVEDEKESEVVGADRKVSNDVKDVKDIGYEKRKTKDPEPSVSASINCSSSNHKNASPAQDSMHSLSDAPKYSPIGPRCDNKSVAEKLDHDKGLFAEDDSMSVSDSVSTTSKLDQIEQNEKQGNQELNKAPLRPPPGLAPPPGFSNSDKLQIPSQDQTFTRHSSSNPSSLLAYNPILSTLLTDHEDNIESSDNDVNVGKEDRTVVDDNYKALFGLGEDFNVMNFFSFLDDGIHTETQNSAVSAEDENLSTIIYDTKSNPVHANPWNGSKTPRALAYGIEVETENNKESNRDEDDIPLLTPSIILGQDLNVGQNEDDKNEVDREDLIFNFSRLLED